MRCSVFSFDGLEKGPSLVEYEASDRGDISCSTIVFSDCSVSTTGSVSPAASRALASSSAFFLLAFSQYQYQCAGRHSLCSTVSFIYPVLLSPSRYRVMRSRRLRYAFCSSPGRHSKEIPSLAKIQSSGVLARYCHCHSRGVTVICCKLGRGATHCETSH
jgi:hypothetical protein